MSTPGRAYALRRLAATRRANRNAMAAGRKPTLGGKRVSAATFTRRTGVTKTAARKRTKASSSSRGHGGRFASYSNTQLRSMSRSGPRRVRPASAGRTRTSRAGRARGAA